MNDRDRNANLARLAVAVALPLVSSLALAEGEAPYLTPAATYVSGTGMASIIAWGGATLVIVAAIWVLRKLGGR